MTMFTGYAPPPRPKAKKRAHPERDVEDAIRKTFRLKYEILLYKTDAGDASWRDSGSLEGRRGHSCLPCGFPDLVGCAGPPHGRMIVIECKAPGGKPTANQRHYLELFKKTCAIAFWADSVKSAIEQYEEATHG